MNSKYPNPVYTYFATGSCNEESAVRGDGETAQVRLASRLCAGDSGTVGYSDILCDRGNHTSLIDPSYRLVFRVVERSVGASSQTVDPAQNAAMGLRWKDRPYASNA